MSALASPELTREELQGLRLRGLKDPAWFCRFFLPDWFPDRQPHFHLGLLAILTRRVEFLLEYPEELPWILANFRWSEDPQDEEAPTHPMFFFDEAGKLVLTLAPNSLWLLPRGFAKTSVVKGACIYLIVYRVHRFLVYASEAAKHAEAQLTDIKDELATNPRLQAVFGTLKPALGEGKWREDEFETTTGVHMVARGRGQQVRGLVRGGDRPSLIVLDDVEDEESVSTAEGRDKALNWLLKAVKPALSRRHPLRSIVAIGTLLHREAALVRLQSDPEWTTVVFGAADPQGALMWPEHMGAEALEAEKVSYATLGKLHVYYMEYFNVLRAEETQKFHLGPELYMPVQRSELLVALAHDPAISEKRTADLATFGVCGINQNNGLIWVLDYEEYPGSTERTPRFLIDRYFALWEKWLPNKAGIESVAFQMALVHLVREEMFRRGRTKSGQLFFHEVIPITHSRQQGNKLERVEGILQPRYSAGYMRHARRFPGLESQLLDWPNGKRDGPDVVAMAVSLLDPFAPMALPAETDPTQDEYEPLEEELGEWREA